jgi:hypothetical protein
MKPHALQTMIGWSAGESGCSWPKVQPGPMHHRKFGKSRSRVRRVIRLSYLGSMIRRQKKLVEEEL